MDNEIQLGDVFIWNKSELFIVIAMKEKEHKYKLLGITDIQNIGTIEKQYWKNERDWYTNTCFIDRNGTDNWVYMCNLNEVFNDVFKRI